MNTQLIVVKKAKTDLVFDTPGKYVVFFSNISGTISCTIKAEKVELFMLGLYEVDGTKKYSVKTKQIHSAPNSFSDLYIVSVVQGSSSFSFSGLIRIEKGARQSHAYQKNQNLLLSEKSSVDSCPILEILANDVFCTHASTSGPISEEQLQLLQMRGIERDEAKNLVVEGFTHQIYDRLSSLGVKNYDTH